MASLRADQEQRDPEQRLIQIVIPNWSLFEGLARGVAGGLIATALMTLYRFPMFRAIPPTSEFWAMFVRGGEPEEYPVAGLVLHFMYGAGAGGVFGVVFGLLDFENERDRRLGTIFLSLVYGLVLSVFGSRVLLKRLLKEDLEPDEAAVFHIAHVIYGLTLGTWLSIQEQSGEVYE